MHSLNQTFKSLSVALVLTSASSHAAVVLNPSFESNLVGDNNFQGIIPSWTIVGGAGTQDFPASQTPQTTFGLQHAYVGLGESINQDTSVTIIGGQTYTLTVNVGQVSAFTGSTATIRLYGNTISNVIAEFTGIAPGAGAYLLDQTFTYTSLASGDPFAGQTVGIALLGTAGTQVIFDNVRFDVGAVPEPSSLLLGGLGALALLRRRRI
jgi:PEP-CTERM motif